MDPPECEVAPVVDVLGLEVALVAGLALTVPVLPLPCAPNPPWNPAIDAPLAPRAIAGAGGECGAIRAWGTELRPGVRIADVEALGPRSDAGAPTPRESEEGADWTKDLGFAGPLARAVACADCLAIAPKLGAGAGDTSSLIPSLAIAKRAPGRIAPLAPCVARIAVAGTEAS